MSALSPASSPRLPSPPPMAEDQLGPLSPAAASHEDQGKTGPVGGVDHGASRRIRPGTKSADMAEGPPLVELKDIDSAFQLTEHLKALHNSLIHPEGKDHSAPVDRNTALRLAQPPDGVDRNIWLYELCRFLSQKVNSIITALFADEPPCSAQTCPEMRASDWQYLCAVHDPPKSCCAIDYCCHTLDWAANTLTSPKSFPSRLALGTEMNNQHTQVRQLTNIFRRVYRIFAHTWFQHRDVFWKVEGRTGLYMFFKTVCDVYNLIDKDNYTIPQEAEGLENETTEHPHQQREASPREALERRESVIEHTPITPAGNTLTVTGNTTKRHRQTPSLSQAPVTTVVEEAEEEEVPKTESVPSKKSGGLMEPVTEEAPSSAVQSKEAPKLEEASASQVQEQVPSITGSSTTQEPNEASFKTDQEVPKEMEEEKEAIEEPESEESHDANVTEDVAKDKKEEEQEAQHVTEE